MSGCAKRSTYGECFNHTFLHSFCNITLEGLVSSLLRNAKWLLGLQFWQKSSLKQKYSTYCMQLFYERHYGYQNNISPLPTAERKVIKIFGRPVQFFNRVIVQDYRTASTERGWLAYKRKGTKTQRCLWGLICSSSFSEFSKQVAGIEVSKDSEHKIKMLVQSTCIFFIQVLLLYIYAHVHGH